jgi:hypothetical protein
MCGLTSDQLLRNGHHPLPAELGKASAVELVMNMRVNPNRSPGWELSGISVQCRVVIHDGVVGGPRGKTPAAKDSMHTI